MPLFCDDLLICGDKTFCRYNAISSSRAEKTKQNPHPGHNLPCSNAKISVRQEHDSKEQFLSNFSTIVRLRIFFQGQNQVFPSIYTTVKINTDIMQSRDCNSLKTVRKS